jgi:hypothetical protein
MKKVLSSVVVLAMMCSVASAGINLQSIRIDSLQADGVYAVYDHTTSKLTWSGGASVSLYSSNNGTGDPVMVFDEQVSVSSVFTMMTDLSSGGVAKAQFAAIDWSVSINGIQVIWGTHGAGQLFVEEEQYEEVGGLIFDSGILWGSGVVDVAGCAFSELVEDDMCWDDDNGDARLKSLVVVDKGFNSYSEHSYNTIISTIWLFADETVIPEPATMALLALGGLAVLRGKRR